LKIEVVDLISTDMAHLMRRAAPDVHERHQASIPSLDLDQGSWKMWMWFSENGPPQSLALEAVRIALGMPQQMLNVYDLKDLLCSRSCSSQSPLSRSKLSIDQYHKSAGEKNYISRKPARAQQPAESHVRHPGAHDPYCPVTRRSLA
jgi:hypothetical protein